MNFRELVRVNIDVFRPLGLIQKSAHPAMASHRTNSFQVLGQIDRGCAVINTEEVTGQTILPIFGELTNLGDSIERPESSDFGGQ